MYEVDEQDKVVELDDVPQSSIGAPLPLVVSDEHRLFLLYLVEETNQKWVGTTARSVSADSRNEMVAVVRFRRPYAHMFGPPNDEAFTGHPLSRRGLHPYGAFKVLHSSWIRHLERMNSAHPYHDPKKFLEGREHFIFAFHGSTFECVASDCEVVDVWRGSLQSGLERVTETLTQEWRS